jgi:rod shape-determining protein MreC
MAKQADPRRFIVLLGILILAVFALSRGWFSPVQSGGMRATSPFVLRAAGMFDGLKETLISFTRVGSLSRQVRLLENDNRLYQAKIARLEGAEEENGRLREQLKLLPRDRFKLLSADVIGHSVDGAREGLIINRGTTDGLREGLPVIVNDGIVVGSIVKADIVTSVVMLVSDTDFRLAASVQGTKAQGLIQGGKGLDIFLEQVPRSEKINVGDKVVTAGVDGLFPANLLVGTVRTVSAPENEIFQSAKISPVLDVRQAQILSVIMSEEK